MDYQNIETLPFLHSHISSVAEPRSNAKKVTMSLKANKLALFPPDLPEKPETDI